MKQFTVYCLSRGYVETFTVEAENKTFAIQEARRQCKLDGSRYIRIEVKK